MRQHAYQRMQGTTPDGDAAWQDDGSRAASTSPSRDRMRESVIESVDGQAIRVLHSDLVPGRRHMTVVLPFGFRPGAARRLFAQLSQVNLLTWQSRAIIDRSAEDGVDAVLTPQAHAADFAAVLKHFDVGKSDVIGFCSGAGIALLAASEYGPMVDRLALVCGEYMLPPDICRQTVFQREVDRLLPLAATGRGIARILCEKLASGKVAPKSELEAEVALPFSDPEYLYRHGVNYLSYRRMDFRRVAKEVRQRTLVISTQDDQQVTREGSALLAAALPDMARHLDLPGDHYAIFRDASPVVEALLRFFQQERR
jgi:pimeloyl-ACP methyl ester carboxylesterase